MRLPLIALIPAAMIMGAYAHAQEQTAEPPAAEPAEAQAEQAEEEQKAPKAPEVSMTEASGSWNRITEGGRDTVAYTSNEGETLFSATCMTAETDMGSNRIVQIKAASADDSVGAIDMFTSAGNARMPAAPDMAPGTAAGMTEPVSRPTYVLASGAGEMRIVSGSRGIIFETDPMLKSLIRGCQPDHLAEFRAKMEAGEFETSEETEEVEETAAEETGEADTSS